RTGGTTVQLAALPTRAAAEAEWQHLRQRMPGLLAGHQLVLAQATVAGRVWWRVRTAGFSGAAQARSFCARMRAAGGACDVTPF
ncbi:MAG: SPOR domain-containing protein, partial [Proteobacteria bacterium]|nr:SPOR domain-containing protein [Pseudomonadota bacterium]